MFKELWQDSQRPAKTISQLWTTSKDTKRRCSLWFSHEELSKRFAKGGGVEALQKESQTSIFPHGDRRNSIKTKKRKRTTKSAWREREEREKRPKLRKLEVKCSRPIKRKKEMENPSAVKR